MQKITMLAVLLSINASRAATMAPGASDWPELAGNQASTSERGTWLLRPLGASSYALLDRVELRTLTPGLLLGPNLAVKWNVLKNATSSVSLEVGAFVPWVSSSFTLFGGSLTYSHRIGPGWLNVQVGPALSRGDWLIYLPATVGYSWQRSALSLWDFHLGSDGLFAFGVYSGHAGFTWSRFFSPQFALQLGANLHLGVWDETLYATLRRRMGGNSWLLQRVGVLPLPHVGVVWRLP